MRQFQMPAIMAVLATLLVMTTGGFANVSQSPIRSTHSPLDNSGGPDDYHYAFVDNSSPDTATYDWIELRGLPGTVGVNDFTSHDDGISTIPLGFNFFFYGQFYNSASLCTNGFIQFNTDDDWYTNNCLPADTLHGPTICLFWDDLHLDRGGINDGMDVVLFRQFQNYVVVEYDSVGRFDGVGSYKFETILFSDGRIKMQYNQFGGGVDTSNTIGIQQSPLTASLQYRCSTDGFDVTEGRAIWFYRQYQDCQSCQPGDSPEIAEDPADTSYYHTDPNGGCNSDPPRYISIAIGQTVCGHGFFYLGPSNLTYRDTDWYTFTVVSPETVSVAYHSEFAAQVGIIDFHGDCSQIDIVAGVYDTTFCHDSSFSTYLMAGTYALFVAPDFDAPAYLFGDTLGYRATVYHGVLAADNRPALQPASFALSSYPNPFNPSTQLAFTLPERENVRLIIYDVTGREVAELADGSYPAGVHTVTFDGSALSSGIYFARLTAGRYDASRKIVLLK